MKMRDQILTVARAFCVARGLSQSRVATIFFNDGKKLDLLEAGGGLTTDKFEEVMAKFSAQWPENTLWPAGVPRPAPLEAERVS